jgi:hypothetical protein
MVCDAIEDEEHAVSGQRKKPNTTDADSLSQADNQEVAERFGVPHW